MSVQQSINQSILAAGALYSQSGAAEQRKGKLELQKEVKDLKEANKQYDILSAKRGGKAADELFDALEEYRMRKAENVMNLGLKSGNFKAYEVGRRNVKEKSELLNDPKRHEEFKNDPNFVDNDYDPEVEDELAKRAERQAVDEYEMAAQKEKDRREKIRLMKQANRAAVKKRMEMLYDRDFRDNLGGN